MPTQDELTAGTTGALAQPWIAWWQHADTLCRDGVDWVARCYDPRQLRNRWLASLSQLAGQYARSPTFLEVMQVNLRALNSSSRLLFPHRPR